MRRDITAVLLIAAGAAEAQETRPVEKIELDYIRTPTSPAFVLLGVTPTSITRPSNPRALATELLSSTKRGNVIPNNYAVEFAPYWLASHPALTQEQYSAGQRSAWRSLSFSLATSRGDTATDSLAMQVAVGARTLLRPGRTSKRYKALDDSLVVMQKARLPIVRDLADAEDEHDEAEIELLQSLSGVGAQALASARSKLKAANEKASAARTKLAAQGDTMREKAIAMGREERVGSFLEVAAAVSAAYPTATFESGKMSRGAVWGTYTYRTESDIDLMMLGRLLADFRSKGTNAGDVGGRVHWAKSDVGFSAEWLVRAAFRLGDPTQIGSATQRSLTYNSSQRAVGVVDYRAADDMYVTISFGQDFKQLAAARHPLIALFGFQLLYGDKPVVKPKLAP